jgi:hypothetical protein
MSKTFKTLLLVLLAVIAIQTVAVVSLYRRNAQMGKKMTRGCVIGNPRFAWNSLPPKSRAELISALIYVEMIFENQTLPECLQQLSDRTSDLIGRGLSSSIGAPGDLRTYFEHRISMRFKETTLGEILKHLGEAFGATIELTEYCIYATYGKPEEKKP